MEDKALLLLFALHSHPEAHRVIAEFRPFPEACRSPQRLRILGKPRSAPHHLLRFPELLKFKSDIVEGLMTSLDRWLHPVKFSVEYPGRGG